MEINEYVIQAQGGNVAAFEELYHSFSQKIFFYIRKKIQNREEAEDILQEVFIKSYRGLKSLRPGEINFSAWLYKIASNTINDHFRKKYRCPEVVSIDENFDLPDKHCLFKEIVTRSDLEGARENLNKLPELHKNVIELRFFQELSVDEVAKTLNKSNLSVRMIQYRARKNLKLMYENAY
jgi:RNA polymerase sigma-70 factor (ECF subfamily)